VPGLLVALVVVEQNSEVTPQKPNCEQHALRGHDELNSFPGAVIPHVESGLAMGAGGVPVLKQMFALS
jgi:hypothetical protein